MDVLVLCHFDDSMLICHPRISGRLKDGRRSGRRKRRISYRLGGGTDDIIMVRHCSVGPFFFTFHTRQTQRGGPGRGI